MNTEEIVKKAIKEKRVILGSKRSIEAILRKEAKMVIIAENCPEEYRKDAEKFAKLANVELVHYHGSGVELGELCRKPFSVAMLAIK